MSLHHVIWLGPMLSGGLLLAALFGLARLSASWAVRWPDLAPNWRYLMALLEMLSAVAILIAGLSIGLWQQEAVGLLSPDWETLAEWWPGYAAGMALWIVLLFAPLWRRRPASQVEPRLGPVTAAARLIRDEALLAALRAALAPAMTVYWGAWAAAGLRVATRWWFATGRPLRPRGASSKLLVDAALDISATVVIIMAGSLWLALATRALLYGVASAAQTLIERRSEHQPG